MLEKVIEKIGPVTALLIVAVLVGMQLQALFGSMQGLLDLAAEADEAVTARKREELAKAVTWQTWEAAAVNHHHHAPESGAAVVEAGE